MSLFRILPLLCLMLMSSCSTPQTVLTECYPRADWFSFYLVTPDDTPEIIADLAHTTVDALLKANCLADGGQIHEGVVLRVPQPRRM